MNSQFVVVLLASVFPDGRRYSAIVVSTLTAGGVSDLTAQIQRATNEYYPWFSVLKLAKTFAALLSQEYRAKGFVVDSETLRREVSNGRLCEFSQKGKTTKLI